MDDVDLRATVRHVSCLECDPAPVRRPPGVRHGPIPRRDPPKRRAVLVHGENGIVRPASGRLLPARGEGDPPPARREEATVEKVVEVEGEPPRTHSVKAGPVPAHEPKRAAVMAEDEQPRAVE